MRKKLILQYIAVAGLLSLSACSSAVPAITTPQSTMIPSAGDHSISPVTTEPKSIVDPAQRPTIPPDISDQTQKPATLDVSKIGQPVLISDKFMFTEGPVWDRTRNVLLFSDIDANRIYQLTLPDTTTVFREPSNKSNGLTFDTQGRLLAAEHGSRSVTRSLPDNTVEKLADSYLGKPLNSPNDLVVRTDGTIYFTDPIFGLENRPKGVDFMGLYRIGPAGDLVLEGKFDKSPNGVALSPDEKILYLALTHGAEILAFDIAIDGKVSNMHTFASVQQPDGLAVDILGNVYVAGFDGVHVFLPNGNELGIIKTKQQPTNCDFGGAEGNILFITARNSLYRVEAPIPGFIVGK
jgi:gluconolactonase